MYKHLAPGIVNVPQNIDRWTDKENVVHIGYYNILNRVPCAIQPTSSLIVVIHIFLHFIS